MSDLKDAVLKAVDGAGEVQASSMALATLLQVTHNEVVGVIKSLQAIDAQLLDVAVRKIVKFVPTDEGEPFIRSAAHSFTHSSVRSLIHSLVCSFTHSLIHSLVCSFVHSLTHSLIHSPTRLFVHSRTHARTHARTHSLTHSLTHAL